MNRYSKRRISAKRAMALVLSVALAVSFTSCGKEQINYDVENQGQAGGDSSVSADTKTETLEDAPEVDDSTFEDDAMAATLKDALGVDEDIWEANFSATDASGVLFNNVIKAEISVPNISSMSVLELEKKTITNEDRKRIVEGLFDADTIYAESEEDMPEWYVDNLLSSLDKYVIHLELVKSVNDELWTRENEDSYQNLLSQRVKMQDLKDNAPGIGIKTSDYSEDLYFGDINGNHYWLRFSENGFSCYANDYSTLVTESLLENGTIYCEAQDTESTDNQCAVSAEDMERTARSILTACGLDEYTINSTNTLHWINSSATDYIEWDDGYSLFYTRSVNGISVDYTNYENMDFYHDSSDDGLDLSWDDNLLSDVGGEQEYISVKINEQGLAEIVVPCLYEIKEDLTEQAPLLPFSNVKEAIQSSLEANPNPYGFEESYVVGKSSMVYTKLDLIYMYVVGEENKYALLPVWRLSGWKSGSIARMICINAIDGSVVDMLSDMYQVIN